MYCRVKNSILSQGGTISRNGQVSFPVCPDCPPAVTRSTATLMKTGQTTSYRTGDDGDLEAGRATDFLTLDAAPLHNNGSATLNTTINRFTDILGGQTYADDIVLDWSTWNGSTLLGYSRVVLGNPINWNNAIDGALSFSVGSFVSGWRLPNIIELISLSSFNLGTHFNYTPFNISAPTWLWSSTTGNASTSALASASSTRIAGRTKTDSVTYGYIPVRTFSLSLLNVLS